MISRTFTTKIEVLSLNNTRDRYGRAVKRIANQRRRSRTGSIHEEKTCSRLVPAVSVREQLIVGRAALNQMSATAKGSQRYIAVGQA